MPLRWPGRGSGALRGRDARSSQLGTRSQRHQYRQRSQQQQQRRQQQQRSQQQPSQQQQRRRQKQLPASMQPAAAPPPLHSLWRRPGCCCSRPTGGATCTSNALSQPWPAAPACLTAQRLPGMWRPRQAAGGATRCATRSASHRRGGRSAGRTTTRPASRLPPALLITCTATTAGSQGTWGATAPWQQKR